MRNTAVAVVATIVFGALTAIAATMAPRSTPETANSSMHERPTPTDRR